MFNLYVDNFARNVSIFFLLCMAVLSMPANAQTLAVTTETEICWRTTYGRGVGTIPGECDWSNQAKSGLLCYPKCKPGYKNIAGVCWAPCPPSYRDDGAFCRLPEYGRGAGYWLWDGDKCKRENSQGCEQWGAFIYPKCKPGYTNAACCICKPIKTCPAGWSEVAGSCAKPSYVVEPITPHCGTKQYDAGLCYDKCKAGYSGVGPVCWGECPKSHPVNCGAACAKTEKDCQDGVKDMFLSVFNVASNVASLVSTAGTAAAAKVSAQAAIKAALKAVAKKLANKFLDRLKKVAKSVVIAELKKQMPKLSPALAEKMASGIENPEAFDFGDLDPTGILETVKAYNKPICQVDPTIPSAPPLMVTALTARAIGPNPCAKMLSDEPAYSNIVSTPVANWTNDSRNTAIVILVNATGLPTSFAQGLPNDQLLSALTADCSSIRSLPSFKSLSEARAPSWSNDQRNTAITIVSNAYGIDIPRVQAFSNVELMGFLRGQLSVDELRAIGPNPCAKMVSEGRYSSVIGTLADRWNDGLRNTAIVIINDATGLGIPTLQKWNNRKLFHALTADCSSMPKNPIYDGLVATPEHRWSDDMRNGAIVIINNASGIDIPTLQALGNAELLGLLRGKMPPAELRAMGPNPCAKMLSDEPHYSNIVKTPAAKWTDDQRNTAIVILTNATGLRVLVAQGWPNVQILYGLTTDCSSMRKIPVYNSLSATPADKWSNDQRNTAIVIINNASGIEIPRLQGLHNAELMGFLRGL